MQAKQNLENIFDNLADAFGRLNIEMANASARADLERERADEAEASRAHAEDCLRQNNNELRTNIAHLTSPPPKRGKEPCFHVFRVDENVFYMVRCQARKLASARLALENRYPNCEEIIAGDITGNAVNVGNRLRDNLRADGWVVQANHIHPPAGERDAAVQRLVEEVTYILGPANIARQLATTNEARLNPQ